MLETRGTDCKIPCQMVTKQKAGQIFWLVAEEDGRRPVGRCAIDGSLLKQSVFVHSLIAARTVAIVWLLFYDDVQDCPCFYAKGCRRCDTLCLFLAHLPVIYIYIRVYVGQSISPLVLALDCLARCAFKVRLNILFLNNMMYVHT